MLVNRLSSVSTQSSSRATEEMNIALSMWIISIRRQFHYQSLRQNLMPFLFVVLHLSFTTLYSYVYLFLVVTSNISLLLLLLYHITQCKISALMFPLISPLTPETLSLLKCTMDINRYPWICEGFCNTWTFFNSNMSEVLPHLALPFFAIKESLVLR